MVDARPAGVFHCGDVDVRLLTTRNREPMVGDEGALLVGIVIESQPTNGVECCALSAWPMRVLSCTFKARLNIVKAKRKQNAQVGGFCHEGCLLPIPPSARRTLLLLPFTSPYIAVF